MKFSIIVPVYNAERYLDACIASVKSQRFQSWELILVDDGSTDRSGELLERYAAKDGRIHVLHQSNRGQFFARQKGIAMSQGDYLLFLDSDDAFAPDSLQTIDEAIRKKDPDIVLYPGKIVINGSDTARCIGFISPEEQDVSVQWLRQSLISSHDMNSLFLKAFRRQLFDGDETDYSSFEGKSYGEDKVRLLYPLSKAKRIFYIPDKLYLYNRRADSVMHRLELDAVPRLIENDMFALLYRYMRLWNMDDHCHREAVAVYYLKNYLSVYFGLRKGYHTARERKALRRYPWGRVINKKAFRYFFSRRLGLKNKVMLLIAVTRL